MTNERKHEIANLLEGPTEQLESTISWFLHLSADLVANGERDFEISRSIAHMRNARAELKDLYKTLTLKPLPKKPKPTDTSLCSVCDRPGVIGEDLTRCSICHKLYCAITFNDPTGSPCFRAHRHCENQ